MQTGLLSILRASVPAVGLFTVANCLLWFSETLETYHKLFNNKAMGIKKAGPSGPAFLF